MGHHARKLRITVCSAKNTGSHHSWIRRCVTDAFVVICVDDDTMRPLAKTRVIHNSLSPVWDETFILNMRKVVACRKTIPVHLSFCLSDEGTFGAKELGAVHIPFADIMRYGTVKGEFPLTGPFAQGTLTIKITDGRDGATGSGQGVSADSAENGDSSSGHLSTPDTAPGRRSIVSTVADLAAMALGRATDNLISPRSDKRQDIAQISNELVTNHTRGSHAENPYTVNISWWRYDSGYAESTDDTATIDSSQRHSRSSRDSLTSSDDRNDDISSQSSNGNNTVGMDEGPISSREQALDIDDRNQRITIGSTSNDDRNSYHSDPDVGDKTLDYEHDEDDWGQSDSFSQPSSPASNSS